MFDFNPFPKKVYKKTKKNKKDRGQFLPEVRKQVIEDFNGCCGHCGKPGNHIHHVKPKGSGGRGVYTNALLLCFICHERVHREPRLLNYYIKKYTALYGERFFWDEKDHKGDVWDV